MTVRQIVEKLLQSHFKPCDCLNCRKGGRIDVFLAELTELVVAEHKMAGQGEINFILGWNSCIDRVKEILK